VSLAGVVAFSAPFSPPAIAPANAPANAPVAVSVDFKQAANGALPSPGSIFWINSIIQQSNSTYAEGMSVPLRLVLVSIPATAGHVHELHFAHQATKVTGIHCYDFLTSWGQAVGAAQGKGPGGANLLDQLALPAVVCGPNLGPTVTQALCDSLWQPGSNPVIATGALPDMGPIGGGTGNVQAQIDAYEAALGNRLLTVRAPAGQSVSNVQVTFLGYSAASDSFAQYALRWTSASPTIGIEFAGHLAAGSADGLVPGYGAGWGASAISGGIYHFTLSQLDGALLGNQDSQIKGADIMVPLPPCAVGGPTSACQGATNLQFTDGLPVVPTISYAWTFMSNTSGATFASATNGNLVGVNAGGGVGTFTLALSKTNVSGTTTCTATTIVTSCVSPWTPLGSGLAGVSGIPQLSGSGNLLPCTSGALGLVGAAPSAQAALFVAAASTPTPFKGGTLIPVPPVLTLVLATNPAGGSLLPWTCWPAGLSGASLYFQYAIKDIAAVNGISLSNALRADVP
jgi:hypothetical protein